MHKRVHLAFTGVAVVAPAYPGPERPPQPGPIFALMPNSYRVRSVHAQEKVPPGQPDPYGRRADISAHLTFGVFQYEHLIPDAGNRRADYKHPNEQVPEKGVCFFSREHLEIDPPPLETEVTYVEGDTTGVPNRYSNAAGWIADWKKFAPGAARFQENALDGEGDFVRLRLPGGLISSRFACEPAPKAHFAYGNVEPPLSQFFAHEIVVTMTFDDDVDQIKLISTSFTGAEDPAPLVFTWGDTSEFKITFATGVLTSLHSVLSGSCAGHDHEGRADHEFQLLYREIIDCDRDYYSRLPVPTITSREILRIPCLSSMIEAPYESNSKSDSRKSADESARESKRKRTRTSAK